MHLPGMQNMWDQPLSSKVGESRFETLDVLLRLLCRPGFTYAHQNFAHKSRNHDISPPSPHYQLPPLPRSVNRLSFEMNVCYMFFSIVSLEIGVSVAMSNDIGFTAMSSGEESKRSFDVTPRLHSGGHRLIKPKWV
jgi:hypothetical protein